MKIIDARTGNLQSIPFTLGESGRGRWFEEVKVSNRPGQEPKGPEDVSYFTFGQSRQHVILTKWDGKHGVLVRINTAGVYTKGSCGRVALEDGDAILLTEGTWAEGAAGNVANGPDQLWHVKGPAVFTVVLQGGEHKGMGHRYLIVTKSFRTVMLKQAELCQLIATDEDPEISEVARMFQDTLHTDVEQALRLADRLEEQMEAPQAEVTHFGCAWISIEETVRGFDLAIPAAMGDRVKGVSGVQAGTLVPGTKALAVLTIGPGGGKRYRFEKVSESGLTRVKVSCERPYNRESVLAVVEEPSWHSAWINYKDGNPNAYYIADAGGVHSYTPSLQHGDPIETRAWTGIPAVSPTEAQFRKVFGLDSTQPEGGFNNPFAKLGERH